MPFTIYKDPCGKHLGSIMLRGHSNMIFTRNDMKIVYKSTSHSMSTLESIIKRHTGP